MIVAIVITVISVFVLGFAFGWQFHERRSIDWKKRYHTALNAADRSYTQPLPELEVGNKWQIEQVKVQDIAWLGEDYTECVALRLHKPSTGETMAVKPSVYRDSLDPARPTFKRDIQEYRELARNVQDEMNGDV